MSQSMALVIQDEYIHRIEILSQWFGFGLFFKHSFFLLSPILDLFIGDSYLVHQYWHRSVRKLRNELRNKNFSRRSSKKSKCHVSIKLWRRMLTRKITSGSWWLNLTFESIWISMRIPALHRSPDQSFDYSFRIQSNLTEKFYEYNDSVYCVVLETNPSTLISNQYYLKSKNILENHFSFWLPIFVDKFRSFSISIIVRVLLSSHEYFERRRLYGYFTSISHR